jgi:hypothetical protein
VTPGQFTVLLLSAVFAFVANAGLRWWQYRRDLWIARVEKYCEAVQAAADCATEYWSVKKSAKHDDEKFWSELLIKEARLFGLQLRIDELRVSFQGRLSEQASAELIDFSAKLNDALTGGDWLEPIRAADSVRALAAQEYASVVIVRARTGTATAFSAAGTLDWFLRNETAAFQQIMRDRAFRSVLAIEAAIVLIAMLYVIYIQLAN